MKIDRLSYLSTFKRKPISKILVVLNSLLFWTYISSPWPKINLLYFKLCWQGKTDSWHTVYQLMSQHGWKATTLHHVEYKVASLCYLIKTNPLIFYIPLCQSIFLLLSEFETAGFNCWYYKCPNILVSSWGTSISLWNAFSLIIPGLTIQAGT